MPVSARRLTAVAVKATKAPGLYADGQGLYLRVAPGGSRQWVYRFKADSRARDMGLGPVSALSLAQAREKAALCRRQRLEGRDPIDARKAQRAAERSRSTTFQECAEQLITAHEAGWRNAKHRAQWRATLKSYAYPILGKLSVADVTTDLVLRVLQQPIAPRGAPNGRAKEAPLWNARSETASRVRGRIEAVLSWAKARGLRSGENPAAWRGHLDQLLPPRSKVRRVKHRAALPYGELPKFMTELRARGGVSARALEFIILTASRTNEGLGARFDEFDLEARLWTIPAERMKASREHRVPLSDRALAIVKEMAQTRRDAHVFPGTKKARPLSDMAPLMLLRELRPGLTVHGFRSTFKDWCAECTATPNFVSEAALAHVVADKVEAAYRRADLLAKRRELMQAWADYCE
jgi:integrase